MNMKSADINRIIGVNESFELPDKLMAILLEGDTESMFEEFLTLENDMSFDWFTNYFQENHSNRDKMMQDYTPSSLTSLVADMAGSFTTVQDVCAGTGGLTISTWNKNHDARFLCEELSARSIPFLLFNLAIRNINACVLQKDVLNEDVKAVYQIVQGKSFGRVVKVDEEPDFAPDLVIMNPPYSLKWKHTNKIRDKRFEHYPYPPTNFSDLAFVIHGLNRLKDGGKLFAILPHGVLFRGRQEQEIRQRFIEDNILDSIIGLPDKLFLNTSIPVCIMALKKNRTNNDILFIDASKEYEPGGKQNHLTKKNTERILFSFKFRESIEKFSHSAKLHEIKENDFNLNIPRYVDTYEPEPVPDPSEVMEDLVKLNKDILKAEKELFDMMKQLTSEDKNKEIRTIVNGFETIIQEKKDEQMYWSFL